MTSTVQTAASIATDPYLPEVVCRAGQLSDIEAGRPVRSCNTIPDGYTGGIGLRKAMVPLRAYVYAEQRPYVYPVAAAVVLGIPFLLGYVFGKGRR